jgi:2-oxoglutarate dehydrogenase E1 component
MLVCNVTTPAQYFHLLRRQALADYRKPLVVMTPKSLLRHPQAVSDLADFSDAVFAPVIDDPARPLEASKVLLCSGKIYYELVQRCRETSCKDIAIVRLEQLYPFPEAVLGSILSTYTKATSWAWVQEEPENMGAWQFVRHRFGELIGQPMTYIGRPAAASPATGFPNIYRQQQNAIADEAVGPLGGGKGTSIVSFK